MLVKRKTRINAISVMFIFLLISEILLGDQLGIEETAEAATSKTVYVDFVNNGRLVDSPPGNQYSSSSSKNYSMDLSEVVAGNITSWTVTANGAVHSSCSSSCTSSSNLTNIKGMEKEVYGKTETNPGHQIYRDPNGKAWGHKGAKTDAVQFPQQDAPNLPSKYPGIIPTSGWKQGTNEPYDYLTGTKASDIRYQYGAYQTDDGTNGDYAPNWPENGWAVTTSYSVTPPTSWYTTNTAKLNEAGNLVNDKIDVSTRKISGGSSHENSPSAKVFSWGGDTNGNGILRIKMLLEEALKEDKHYDEDKGTLPHGNLRNYFMWAIADWKALTYEYDVSIDVTYTPPVTPDLSPTSLTIDSACVQSGDTVTFTLKYKNLGTPANMSFKVRVNADGTQITGSPLSISGYFNTGVEYSKTFTYKFGAADKTISVVMDSANEITEASESNNSKSLFVDVKTSCGPVGGGYTGETSADKSAIGWKDSNLLESNWSIPPGCTPVRGKFIISQASTGAYFEYGWATLTATAKSDTTIFATGMMGYPVYPGNMQSGEVLIEYTINDSCGGYTTFGTGKFTIGPKPPNKPPQFEIGFFAANDYYSTTPIEDTVIGDRVNLRVIERAYPKTPVDPDDDEPLTVEWLFLDSESNWVKSFKTQGYDENDFRLNNITANIKGFHSVKAIMCDPLGACSEQSTNINVMQKEPIACINVPARVVQNRPIPVNGINGDCSKASKGRTITQFLWTNKLPSYPNVGTETVELEVIDNTGVKNLPEDKAAKLINVVEDKPPIASINLPTVSIRGNVTFSDTSRSIDGDVIVSTSVSYQYDADNDGNFDEHSLVEIPIAVGSNASLSAPTIGKYRLTVTTVEDWGLSHTARFIVDIRDDAPSVAFTVEGANPEPPRFNVTTENEMLMAFGLQWQGSSLTNNNLHKTSQIGLTYNTATKGLSSHYGKAPFNGPGANLVMSPIQSQTLARNAPTSYSFPQLFGTQYLGDRYKVGVYGAIEMRLNPSYSGGTWTTTLDSGKGYYYDPVTQTNKPVPVTADSPGIFLVNDSNGGTYSVESRNWSSKDSDGYGDSGQNWTIFRKDAQGNVTFQVSGAYFDYNDSDEGDDDDSYSTGTPYYTVLQSMKLNHDGTKVGMEYPGKAYCYCADWNNYKLTWYDTTTGAVVPNASISLPPTFSALYEDDEVTVYAGQDSIENYNNSNYSNSGNGSGNGSSSYTLTPYILSYNKITGVSTRLNIHSGYTFTRSYSYNYNSDYDYNDDAYRDVRYSVSADGYVYVVDGFNKVIVANKHAVKLAEHSTLGLRPRIVDRWDRYQLDELRTYSIQAGLGSDGVFHVFLHEDYERMRYYNVRYESCGSCSAGSYVSSYDLDYTGSFEKYHYFTITGDTTTTPVYASAEVGQIAKKDTLVDDADYYYDFLQTSANYNLNAPSGLNFRMQDNRNMYRMEHTTNSVRLSKIVNGVRTELRSTPVNLDTVSFSNIKVSVRGTKIKVRMNQTPLFEVSDSSFAVGSYGFFMGGYGSHFRNVYVHVPIVDKTTIKDKAIVGEDLIYGISYEDPEGDPHLLPLDSWKVEHIDPWRFLDSGDGRYGVSVYNNQVLTGAPVVSLDRVGIYRFTYIGTDDPAPPTYVFPNSTFAVYRAQSDPYSSKVLIHRRPIGVLSISQDMYYKVSYDDQSYDPDRWLPGGTCSYEATGIDYCSTRGITDRMYSYVLPDGTLVDGKLGRVNQMGLYTFRVAVRDEYGAWSDWVDTYLWLNAEPINHPPVVTLTNPTGTQSAPSESPASNPTMTWKAVDYDEASRITAYEYYVQSYQWGYLYPGGYQYYWANYSSQSVITVDLLSDGAVLDMSRTLNMTVADNVPYKFRLRVRDEKGLWSDWVEGVFSKGYPPTATLTYPLGTQDNPAVVSGVIIPRWTQTDPDVPTTYTSWYYRFLDAAGNPILYGTYNVAAQMSGSYKHACSTDEDNSEYDCSYTTTQGSWTAENGFLASNLPKGAAMQLQVRVIDNTGKSSAWSTSQWIVTNRPPVASMIIPSGTQAAPTKFAATRLTFTWNQTDPDHGTTFTYFQLQVTNEANTSVVFDSGQVWQGTTSTTGTYAMTTDLPAGQKMRVRVRTFDGVTWSDWSTQTWMYINRSPVAWFDWSPKPVWEGDSVSITNQSTDPDGDPMTYVWSVRKPDLSETTVSTIHVSSVFDQVGDYEVTLFVSDGIATDSLTRTISVAPLTILSDVSYTEQWLANHQNKGHNTTIRPKDFYSGEIWVVETRSSPAPVLEAKAWIDTTGLDGGNLFVSQTLFASEDPELFEGELFDTKLMSMTEGLPPGQVDVHFQIHYSNGVVKTEIVPIRIIGNIHQSVGVHRVQ
jgi:hypothetical protein